MGYGVQLLFNLALIASVAILFTLIGLAVYEIRPFKNLERGIAALTFSFPASVLLTMVLVYLDTPYIFLSLFGGPGLSVLLVPPAGWRLWRVQGGILLALSAFMTLVTSGVVEM